MKAMMRTHTQVRRAHPWSSAVAWAAALGVAGASAAQNTGATGGQSPPGLTPVDQGWNDTSPFRLSFRRMDVDFRLPLGFERVYQLPQGAGDGAARAVSPPWSSAGQTRYARISGALAAVFPQSAYEPDGKGKMIAVVPAATRFVIGRLDTGSTQPPTAAPAAPRLTAADHAADTRVSSAVDRRVDRSAPRAVGSRVAPGTPTPAREPGDVQPPEAASEGMLTSETYRVRRVAGLLNDAAKDDGGGEGGESGQAAE